MAEDQPTIISITVVCQLLMLSRMRINQLVRDGWRGMTRELKEICRQEAPTLVKELIRLATSAESEAVRVAAIKEMFDRGFGRATQPSEGTMTYGVSEQLAELFKENASGTLGSE